VASALGLWLLAGALAAACLETVDLTSGAMPGDAGLGDEDTCPAETRQNPASGRCEHCLRPGHPFLACACGYVFHAAPFPYCEGDDVAYSCDATCAPDSTACNAAFNPDGDGSVRDCSQMAACCALLARTPGSAPCCGPGSSFFCTGVSAHYWPYTWVCIDNGCCETSCVDDSGCRAFQTCVGGRCTPGCDTDREYCDLGGSPCLCREATPP